MGTRTNRDERPRGGRKEVVAHRLGAAWWNRWQLPGERPLVVWVAEWSRQCVCMKKWCGRVWQGAKNETKTLGKPRVSRSRRGGKTDPTGTRHCAAHAGPPRDAISGPQRPRSRVKVAVFTPDKMAELLWRTTHKTHPADVNTMKSASCVAPEHSKRWVPSRPPGPRAPRPPWGPRPSSVAGGRLLRGAIFRATGLSVGFQFAPDWGRRRGRGPPNRGRRDPVGLETKATWERVHYRWPSTPLSWEAFSIRRPH